MDNTHEAGPKLFRPIPRRPFSVNFSSPTPPEEEDAGVDCVSPQRPQISASDLRFLDPHQHGNNHSNSNSNTPSARDRGGTTPLSHTTSYLNLTSPTLYGIYSPITTSPFSRDDDGDQTPDTYFAGDRSGDVLAADADAPPAPLPGLDEATYELMRERAGHSYSSSHARRGSVVSVGPVSRREVVGQLVLRAGLLFVLGVGYGVLLTHLPQKNGGMVEEEQRRQRSYEGGYLAFWGVAGMVLGSLLPWFDRFFEERASSSSPSPATAAPRPPQKSSAAAPVTGTEVSTPGAETEDSQTDWALVIRSIGAFVGIVFAIRKLPWASTMQVSMTLALANPFLWYLIDRSKPGFLLSAAVGLVGAVVVVVLGGDWGMGVGVPAPAATVAGFGGLGEAMGAGGGVVNDTGTAAGSGADSASGGRVISQETVETTVWILSVLFCSCVCFGNIGRRLALSSSAAGRGRWGGVR
ncbi:hypothetical protein VTI74DRAFT_3733 [Chaetomium olivicolor]